MRINKKALIALAVCVFGYNTIFCDGFDNVTNNGHQAKFWTYETDFCLVDGNTAPICSQGMEREEWEDYFQYWPAQANYRDCEVDIATGETCLLLDVYYIQ